MRKILFACVSVFGLALQGHAAPVAALDYDRAATCIARELRRDPDVLDVTRIEEPRSDFSWMSLPVLRLTLRRHDNSESQSVLRFFGPSVFLPGLQDDQMGYAVDADNMNPRFIGEGARRTYGINYRHAPPKLILQKTMARNCLAVDVATLPMSRATMLPYIPGRWDGPILVEWLPVTSPPGTPALVPGIDMHIPSLPSTR